MCKYDNIYEYMLIYFIFEIPHIYFYYEMLYAGHKPVFIKPGLNSNAVQKSRGS